MRPAITFLNIQLSNSRVHLQIVCIFKLHWLLYTLGDGCQGGFLKENQI